MHNFPLTLWLQGGVLIAAIVTLLWILSVRLRDASIIDIFWGPGFFILALFWFIIADRQDDSAGNPVRSQILLGMVFLWAVRLAWHIGRRNIGKGEDSRYRKWRANNGPHWWLLSYPKVYLLQAILMWVLAVPICVGIASDSNSFSVISLIGVIIWVIGFLFETIADFQLSRFKADPSNKGKLLTTGLWKFSRHPNYFGEATLWFGFWLVVLPVGPWWLVGCPLLMLFLLLKVSGVSLLEESMKTDKPGYSEYIKRTNAFIPWLQRR